MVALLDPNVQLTSDTTKTPHDQAWFRKRVSKLKQSVTASVEREVVTHAKMDHLQKQLEEAQAEVQALALEQQEKKAASLASEVQRLREVVHEQLRQLHLHADALEEEEGLRSSLSVDTGLRTSGVLVKDCRPDIKAAIFGKVIERVNGRGMSSSPHAASLILLTDVHDWEFDDVMALLNLKPVTVRFRAVDGQAESVELTFEEGQ